MFERKREKGGGRVLVGVKGCQSMCWKVYKRVCIMTRCNYD